MKEKEKIKGFRYVLAALIPLCVLLWLPLRPALVVTLGQEVRLAAHPVDPRDSFRGDYVALRFDIEEASISLLPSAEAGGDCYVILKRTDAGLWNVAEVSYTPPDAPDKIYLRGKIKNVAHNSSKQDKEETDTEEQAGGKIFFDFGPSLSRFYVPEDTGGKLEHAARSGLLEAVVRVWRGSPLILSLAPSASSASSERGTE